MRNDVKAGMALALIVVVLAGWYYAGDDAAKKSSPLGQPSATPHDAVPAVAPHGADHASMPHEATRSRTTPRTSGNHPVAPPAETATVPLTANTPATDSAAASRSSLPREPGATGRPETLEIYTIQPGDTLAMLAEVYYQNADFARFIQQANPQVKNPNAIPVGTKIRIPAVHEQTAVASRTTDDQEDESGPEAMQLVAKESVKAAPAKSSAAQTTRRETAPATGTYTVRSGDSFYAIAEELLGSGARWPELLKLNHDLVKGDPQRLRPGMVLKVPAK
jgi:nucleoid-associated protein YgaU